MSTIITPSEEQINIVVNDEKISINVESGDVIVNVTENIVEVSTVNGGYPLPTTVYSVFGRTGNIIATEGDYDLGELGDVTLVSSTNGDVLSYDGTKWINKAVTGTGTVTSVDMSVPVGLQVSGNPISTVGTLAVNFAAGYSLPTTAKQTTWDTAYNDSIVSASVSGTTTKTLTLNQQDGGTITASWTDIDTNLVTSVNGYVGTVVLTTSDIAEGSRLYYTEDRVNANTNVAANTAARHSAVTIGTANGLSLASQVLSLALASASTTGALSSTDWATFNNKVPYSGATGNVTLGEYQLSAGQVAFDQSPTGTAGVGILRWNDSDGTLDLGLKGGNVTLQVGQEMVARVVNKTGADLLESGYKVVRISSAQGQRLAVQLAQANNDTNSTDTIGIVTETIANNQEGFITILGQVKEINTTGSLQGETWADGDVLYLSPTTAGNITNIKPVAPSHMVVVGYVEYAHSQHGKIYCKTQNGYELEELHNVLISSVANNQGLFYETATSLWKNKSIATVLGYTPISLTSLSGVSPLSYNNTTGAFSISQAGVSGDGYLSSTDWNTFNNKQNAGNYITALSGEATASGPGSAAVTLSTSAVTGKILTGVNITGGSITATDSILVAFGKVQNQINGVLGGAIYQSTWNASTNNPALTSSTGTKGYYYIVSVAGSTNLDGITDWKVGDWAIFNGATWDKVDNTDAVSSVNGFTGAVSLTSANISEVTNLYYTEGRVSANTDVAANTAARHAAVTLGTANGLSLSTQALSLGLASTSATGALSSTDWNTFNLKQAALSGTGFVKISGSTISYDNSTYALDSDVVKLTGNQTIGSTKTFSLATKNNSGILLSDTSSTSAPSGYISLAGYNYTTSRGLLINLASQSYLFLFNTAAGNSYTFPNATGTLALTSDLTGGTVTSVAALTIGTSGTDLSSSVANSTTTPVITLNVPTASATNRGALSSADWTTFNNKQATITLTTTGTSGAATFTSNTLNIPNYAPDLSGYVTLATTQIITGEKTFSQVVTSLSAYISKIGASDTIGLGSNYNWANGLTGSNDRQLALQMNANNGLSLWYYNGTSWGTSTGINFYNSGSLQSQSFYNTFRSTTNASRNSFQSYNLNQISITGGWIAADFGDLGTTSDRIVMGSGFGNKALLGAHNGALTAWADLYIQQDAGANVYIGGSTNLGYKLGVSGTFYASGAATFGSTLSNGTYTYTLPSATGTLALTSNLNGYLPLAGGIMTGLLDINYNGGFKVRSGATDGFQFLQTNTNTWAIRGLLGVDNITFTNGTGAILVAGAATFSSSVQSTRFYNTFASGNNNSRNSFQSYNANEATLTLGWISADFGDTGTTSSRVVMGSGYSNNAILGAHNGILTAWANLLINPGGGNVIVGGTSNATGLLQISGTVYATGFYESSDIRFKNILETNPNVNVSGIDVIKFTRKDKDIDQVRYGYSAQQVQSILPDAVTGNDFLNVNYLDVHTLKIAALEQRIKELETK